MVKKYDFCTAIVVVVFASLLFLTSASVSASTSLIGKNVLVIGDSHTAGPYGKTLDSLLKSEGAEVSTYGCVGARPSNYVSGGRQCRSGSTERGVVNDYSLPSIDSLLSSVNPDVVIVSLGANNLDSPEESKRLAELIGSRTCFWVGPPVNPQKDDNFMTDFYAKLEDSVGSFCTVIDSRPFSNFNFCGDSSCCCDANVHFSAHGAEGISVAEDWANAVFNVIQDSKVVEFVSTNSEETAPFPYCDGGDVNALKGLYSNCIKYAGIFDKYSRKNGLYDRGVDLNFVMLVAFGESRCTSAEDMRATGKSTANSGIFQVDYPCFYEPEKCPTIEEEVDYGTKVLAKNIDLALSFDDLSLTSEERLALVLLAYNRGTQAVSKTAENMRAGMDIFNAADQACSYYYGWPGSPENGKCGVLNPGCSSHCVEGHRCDYTYYCGKDTRKNKDPFGELKNKIHYSSDRISTYKQMCKQIGGVFVSEGPSRTSSTSILPPTSTLPSGYLFGIDPNVIPPYTVRPSFTVTAPSVLSLFTSATDEILNISDCSSDLSCVEKKLINLNAKNSRMWLAKFAGSVYPSDESVRGNVAKVWSDYCEVPFEYIINSFAEPIEALKLSSDDDCILPLYLDGSSAERELYEGFLGTTIEILKTVTFQDKLNIKFVKKGRAVQLYFGGVEPVRIDDVNLAIDNGDIENLSDDYEFGFDDVSVSKPIVFYKNGSTTVLVELDESSKYSNKQVCSVPEKTVKFCVFDTDKTLWSYDPVEKMMVNRTPRIRFAYLLSDEVKGVENFEVRDLRSASGSVLIEWDGSDTHPIEYYEIFHSSDNDRFSGVTYEDFISDSSLNVGVKSLKLMTDSAISFDTIEVSSAVSCVLSEKGICSRLYRTQNKIGEESFVKLRAGQLYHSKFDNHYFYILSVEDNVASTYGIISVSKSGEKSPRIVGTNTKIASLDDTPPLPPLDLSVSNSEGNTVLEWDHFYVTDIEGSLAEIDHYEVLCTSASEDNFVNLGEESAILKTSTAPPVMLDSELVSTKCPPSPRFIVLPVSKTNSRFIWDTYSSPSI